MSAVRMAAALALVAALAVGLAGAITVDRQAQQLWGAR